MEFCYSDTVILKAPISWTLSILIVFCKVCQPDASCCCMHCFISFFLWHVYCHYALFIDTESKTWAPNRALLFSVTGKPDCHPVVVRELPLFTCPVLAPLRPCPLRSLPPTPQDSFVWISCVTAVPYAHSILVCVLFSCPREPGLLIKETDHGLQMDQLF
jgi:hypothetical protein